jgi:hypothetical protein
MELTQSQERQDVLKMIDLFLIVLADTRELTIQETAFIEGYFERHGLTYLGGKNA